jgi:DNA-binding NarL/FixJ family response regulator
MDPLRLLIVDDNPQFRLGLRTVLRTQPDVDVVGEATSGAEAVELATNLQPDVVLMDVQMPDLNGLEATRQLLQANPHIGVLMLTMFEDDDLVFEAMRAGARGYLLKGALKAELLRAIHGVRNGEAVFGPAIARRLAQYFARPKAPASPALPELTAREREILDLMAQHRSNQVIAARLGLSPKTVRNQVSTILGKLQATDRAEAILRARDAGLGGPRGAAEHS